LGEWPETVRARTAGGILHDSYCAVERVFRHIAVGIDRDLPGGSNRHIQLLRRMATPIPSVRPAVIDHQLERELDEFLRFRHLFRNIYGFDLEWERCRGLLERLPSVFRRLIEQLEAFDAFLLELDRKL